MRNVNEDNGVSRYTCEKFLTKNPREIVAVDLRDSCKLFEIFLYFLELLRIVEEIFIRIISLLMTNLEICIIYKTRFDIGLNVCPNVK